MLPRQTVLVTVHCLYYAVVVRISTTQYSHSFELENVVRSALDIYQSYNDSDSICRAKQILV
jgi:hypothetical protein